MKCIKCGEEISDNAASCPKCGEVFPETVFCKFCGKKIDKDAIICCFCGKQVKELSTASHKSKIAAALLAIFLGGFGIHKFYLGKTGMGMLYLLLTIFLCWTLIVPAIIGIIAFIEGIIYLCTDDVEWNKKY